MTIAVIDYGMGNVGSMRNMLSRIGAEAIVTSDPAAVAVASKIILPGIGVFDHAMERLGELGMVDLLHEKVLHGETPFLGVCLGMQLMSRGSEEGHLAGLGWVDAWTRHFAFERGERDLSVPHMGWNTVQEEGPRGLLARQADNARYYFVHSYYVDCASEGDVLGTTEYGVRFASVIGRGNMLGVQFHPEKSHRFGMTLLENFARGA